MSDDELIPLNSLPREAKAGGLTTECIEYQPLYLAAVAGRIPAHQGPNRRWWIKRGDLAAVVEAMVGIAQPRPACTPALGHVTA